MRTPRLLLALSLTVVALAMAAWLATSMVELHDRLSARSPNLATAVLVGAGLVAAASALAAARLFWVMGHAAPRRRARAPADTIEAARTTVDETTRLIETIGDEAARAELQREIATIRKDFEQKTFHVVVFGTGSAGKTSLINALLGRPVGKTEPTIGTTQHGESHELAVEGVDGRLIVTDTPGLAEIGRGGEEREREARELAVRADLLLFVVEHDLVRSEYEPLIRLARQGKRSIVLFNKVDRFNDRDRDEILAKLRERLAGVVAPADVVAIAAAPRALPVRSIGPDGRSELVYEPVTPDLEALRDRVAAILAREGESLRAGNLLLRAHMIGEAARDRLGQERDRKARQVIERFQWVTAGTVFFNPLPALDLLATGAVQFQMISEIAAAYGCEISTAHARAVGAQMVQTLLKLGMVEAATSLIAGVFKSSLVGFAAGGALQAVTMSYLTHISGLAFAEYFRRGQQWGDGGMQRELARQFDLHSRADFLREFAVQGLQKLKDRYLNETRQPAG